MKKKFLFSLVAMMMMVVSVSAQDVPGNTSKNGVINVPTPQEIAKKETQQMTKNLNLTADQQKQIEAINLKYADQRMVTRLDVTAEGVQNLTADQKAQLKADAQKSIAAQEAEFKTVLTDKQYQTYLNNKAAAKAKMAAKLGKH